MEMNYKIIQISIDNIEYVIGKLKQGKSFSGLALKNIDLQKGKLFTYLPENTPGEIENKFLRSDIADIDISKEYLNSYIIKYLAKKKENIVLFENSFARINDKCIKNAKSKILSLGYEVYHILTSENNNEDVEIARQEATNAWQNILFCSCDTLGNISVAKTVESDDFSELSKNVIAIIVDAYDLNGYIYWERVL